MPAIEIHNLTKHYGKSIGIENVSFNVEEGEIFGFIGPNGAGKSTTIRTLLALLRPTSGSASIFGMDTQKQSTQIHQCIGYLPSEVFYYDHMRVIDLLRYSASFYKKDCTKRINELAEIMQLDLRRKIDDLSYGNKKKVGIVQGMLHDPKLLILDEPTSGLDPLMQQTFFSLLEQEHKKGVTILFSSHILSEVQRLCDRVAIIREGKIIELQTIATLKSESYIKVHLESRQTVDPSFEQRLSGVTNVCCEEFSARFLFKGDVNQLTRLLSTMDLSRLEVGEPDLEEVFMHYYEVERPQSEAKV